MKRVLRFFRRAAQGEAGSGAVDSFNPLRPFEYPPRQRALTLPLQTTNSMQQTHSQSQCTFFMRLPVEVRLQVYQEVFGGRILHLQYDYAPLRKGSDEMDFHWWGCTYKESSDGNGWLSRCRFDKSGIDCHKRRSKEKVGIGLLQSCRKAYSESIDILYGKNTFYFSSDEMLRKMPGLLLPQRFKNITSVELMWPLFPGEDPLASPTTKAAYDDLWELLASMLNLRKLKISIQAMPRADPGPEFDKAWFGPMKKLKHLQLDLFEISLPYSFTVNFNQETIGVACKLSCKPDITLYGAQMST